MPLRRGEVIQAHGFLDVLVHSQTSRIEDSKVELGVGIALVGGRFPFPVGGGIVFLQKGLSARGGIGSEQHPG